MAINERDLQLLEHVLQAIVRSGGSVAESLRHTNEALRDNARDGDAAIKTISRGRSAEAIALTAFEKRIKGSSSSFNVLDAKVRALTATTGDNVDKLRAMANSYELARGSMEDNADKTFKTWDRMNATLPRILAQQVNNLSTGVQLQLESFEDVLKFDALTAAQHDFLTSFQKNNNKLGVEQVRLIQEIQEIGESIGSDYFAKFPQKVQAALEALKTAKLEGKSDDSIKKLEKAVTKSFRGYAQVRPEKMAESIKSMYDQIDAFTLGVQNTSKKLNDSANSFKSEFMNGVVAKTGKLGQMMEAGIKGGFNKQSMAEMATIAKAGMGAVLANAAIDIAKVVKEDFIASARSQMQNDIEFRRVAALSLMMSAGDLAKAQKSQMQVVNQLSGGLKDHVTVLQNSNSVMNKITGYDVEMSTKLSEAAFKAANSLNHQRVSVENSTAIAKSFGKQLQLTSKYTNMSVEEIANYITAVGDSEEVQKNLTLMSTKQKSAYATEIASLLSHARMMGMSAVETDKFVKSMTGSVSTVEEAANATASFQQLLATYGTNLTAEEKQRAALINAKTINGAPLSEGDAADAAYIEEKLIAGLKNNDVVLRAQAERDKANELQERARNTADAKLRAQLEQEATRLHTNSGATLLTMKNQIGAFHEKTAGFGKNAIDTMMSGGQLEAKKADAEVRNRYEKELKMSHNASTELATQIGELSEAIVKLDAYVSGASKSVIGGIVSTAAEVAGAGLLLKVGPAVATATTAAVAETGLLAGAGTALATAATGVMAVVTAPEVLAAVGLVAAGTAIWSSWDSLNDALTAWENEESTPVGLPKPPEVEQVDTTTQTSQEEKHAETSSKLDQVVMLLSSIVGSTREGASANKDLLNTYKTVEQDKLAASGLLEFMNNANNKSQTVAPK